MGNTPQLTEPQTGAVATRQGGVPAHPDNPFSRNQLPEHVNAGTVAVESERAIAEVQAKLVIAKRFPRDEARAYDRVMQACSRPSLAAVAEYSFPRGGQKVSGPSIRLAEELARCYGNLIYGIRELSRTDGASEMQAFAWDLETNVESTQNFTVRHIRDRKSSNGGNVALTDERDIYEITANMGGRRLRARILAILPPDLVEAAVEKCRATLAGNSQEPIADRVKKMIEAFKRFGVTSKHLSDYLGKKLDDVIPEDIADLTAIYTSLKDGVSQVSDYFGAPKVQDPADASNDNQPQAGGQDGDGKKAPAAAKPSGGSKRKAPAKAAAKKNEQQAPAEEAPQPAEEASTETEQADDAGTQQQGDDDFDDMFKD